MCTYVPMHVKYISYVIGTDNLKYFNVAQESMNIKRLANLKVWYPFYSQVLIPSNGCHVVYLVRVRNEKIDDHKITTLLFQTVGHVKVFFYVPINLVYLSLYDGNCD